MKKKLNHAADRRENARILFDKFVSLNREYTCIASFTNDDDMRELALKLAEESIKHGYRHSKGNYPMTWKGNIADIFLFDALKIYYDSDHYRKFR